MRFLEAERYHQALAGNSLVLPEKRNRQTFLDEQWLTQCSLEASGISSTTPINGIPGIDQPDYHPEWAEDLPPDFIIEVAGMPRAGKYTVINKWLETLWQTGSRNRIHFLGEAADNVPDGFRHLKRDDPFAYQCLTEITSFGNTFTRIVESVSGTAPEVPLLSSRGGVDRVAFRRALFLTGKINPQIMEDEWLWEYYFVAPPQRTGAVILCLVKPEVSLAREGPRNKPGPIMNPGFLKVLYEQYLRLHRELSLRWPHRDLTRGLLPFYIALNMEGAPEENFEKFRQTMNLVLPLAKSPVY